MRFRRLKHSHRRMSIATATIALASCLSSGVVAQSPAGQPTSTSTSTSAAPVPTPSTPLPPAPKPNTALVEVAPIKIAVELEGVVDSPAKAQFTLKPKTLKEMRLMGVLPHGSKVSQGQVVLQLDADAYERARRSAEQAVAAAELDFKQSTMAIALLEESLRIELEAAEQANNRAQEELEYYLKFGRPKQEDDLRYSIEASEQGVEYLQEEYDQLKKMYDADELTEESEEIVLKRALNNLKRAQRGLENTKRSVERQLSVEMNRQEAALKNSTAKTKLEFEKLVKSKEAKLITAKLGLAKSEATLESAKKELTNLNEDRQLLAAASPFAGVVFWGAVSHLGWKGPGSVDELQNVGGALTANKTLLTVVSTDKLFVRATLTEKQLPMIRPGMAATFEPTAKPESRLQLVCEERSDIPTDPGTYRANFRINTPADLDGLLPLMTGRISGVVYEKEKSLVIPFDAVRFEDSKVYVMIFDTASGKSTRQDVILGKRDGKRVEVNQGLREGEHVVLP
ncbi:MAG: HlyD family efflux transporter periplasmic adaptor subunit [Pirellulales bacterium]